ncbi:MAG: alkaline phosphatase family protein [Planctomycetes bacterium]|nr:alkaline phosphatase family protein [Planctomycetota bacterium]
MNPTRGKAPRLFLLAAWIALAFSSQAEAYIGPGAGFALLGSFLVLFISILLAFGTILLWPIRALLRIFHKRRALTKSHVDRVIVLGLDGLDPALARKFMAEGKLPHFQQLAEQGCFHDLETTIPSMSPVAWSTFQTGVDPSKHNIFDFLARDVKSYLSVLSSTDIRPSGRVLKLGKWRIPLGKPRIKLLRRAVPFWKILGDRRIFSAILRVPITFPPEKFSGVSLSAMCVPDLRGTQGTFSYFTTGKIEGETIVGVKVPVTRQGDTVRAELVGPPNSLVAGEPEMKAPFTVKIDAARQEARITLGGASFTLKPRQFSDWIKVEFKAGLGIKVGGICRFCVIELEPEFKLYVTPLNLDPNKPAMPISHPFTYAIYLAKKLGPYATLGLAEDTWALNERVIDEEIFLTQAYLIHEERERMFFDALDKVRSGVVACVFDATDRIQHMFMRYLDPTHPANRGKDVLKHKGAIEDLYVRMDRLLGRTLEHVGAKTVLMVISDHGFKNFRRGVNLNSWLLQHGYLALKEGCAKSRDWFQDVDWKRTKAFALGLSGMYLNLKGREAKGIVAPGAEEAALKAEIAGKLGQLRDEQEERAAITEIYDARKIMKGPYVTNCPDLLIGYAIGYRASWDCAVGKVDGTIIEDNVKSWSGDHCIDPRQVPGVFFCNRKIDGDAPRILDIAPTILHLFGVAIPPHMDGASLFRGDPFDGRAPARPEAVA